MAIKMVREPSDTPNINNIDDITPIRYSYGNQNGYVINKGQELSYTINGNKFIVNSGRIVLQGVESDIDANGVELTIEIASTKRYFVVYYEVNLATNKTKIALSDYSTTDYPQIDAGDDLSKVSSGTARMEIYRFTATNGVISEVSKMVKSIEYSGTALVGYDINKGTVEERLTNLGFREGAVQGLVKPASVNYVKRQGNYVVGRLKLDGNGEFGSCISIADLSRDYIGNIGPFGTIPQEFLPKENYLNISVAHGKITRTTDNSKIYYMPESFEFLIYPDGKIMFHQAGYSSYIELYNNNSYHYDTGYFPSSQDWSVCDLDITIGYEAKPIQ